MSRAAAIVLAAGAGSRFGGQKLLAELNGTPILQYVLNIAATAELDPVVIVLGVDSEALVTRLWWRDEVRLVNPTPEAGLSSSVRMGLAALELSDAERVVVLLGDQPRLSATQLDTILTAPQGAARPFVVPRYAGVPGNPVLLERAAWPLAAQLTGDAGMAQLFAASPELVRYVDVDGTNPDIDTRRDLADLGSAPQS
ncbi:MAG: nucleotidyltransferase family protein [Chloroflexota bacterium]|nr:nucleotidyltransferase family protein [Chloroflexota bacterium]